ncbi:hypothetical protein EW145_g3189, partial [Phellinidium pouzarii]
MTWQTQGQRLYVYWPMACPSLVFFLIPIAGFMLPRLHAMVEKTIDGNQLFEPQTKLWIPFKTRSDALLAQLPLQYGLSTIHFNLFLEILHDPSFSPRDLTFRDAADVDMCISERRRNLAHQRSLSVLKDEARECAGMSPIVLDLVLDQIIEGSPHFSYEVGAMPGGAETGFTSAHNWQADLRRMCLVHRSWTAPAQRALQRRAILTERRALPEFARSLACGSGVREFAYKLTKADTCTSFHECSVAREHWATLATVLSRLTNLRYLCLRIESAHLADLSGFEFVLRAIGTMSSLEALWLLSSRDHCPYLPNLCVAISKLQNLRFLSICNWTCPRKGITDIYHNHTFAREQESALTLSPPSQLKTLQLRDTYLIIPPAYFSWFFQPRDEYALTALDLQLTFARPPNLGIVGYDVSTSSRIVSAPVLAALEPLLPNLTTLALRLFYLDTSSAAVAAAQDSDVQTILG